MFNQQALKDAQETLTQFYYVIGLAGLFVLGFVFLVVGVLVHESKKRHDSNHSSTR
jgi:uncharacterized membrane protein YuzA (DUF378 family)